MAITQNTFTGDGSTTNYSFTFEYIKQADVKAKIDGVNTTAFTLANATTVSFTSAPSNGATIIVFRDTDNDEKTATFFAGSAIKAEDLNSNFDQVLFTAQEVDNNALQTLGGTMSGNINMGANTNIVFEGTTDNANETTLTVVDPTADRTITLPDVTGTVVTTGDTGTVATGMIADSAITSAKISDGTIATGDIADDAITTAKIADANVTTALIADASVTTAKLASDAVTTAKITDANVTTAKIADDAVTAAKIAANAVGSSEIAADAVTSSELADASVDTAAIVDANVTTVKVADAAITTAKINDSAITSAKIGANQVVEGKIADNAVTTSKIPDSGVTTPKIADNAVTNVKLADAELRELATMGSTTASALADLTQAEVQILDGATVSTNELNILDGVTANATEINQLDGNTLTNSFTSSSTTQYPSSNAISGYVLGLMNNLGGFVAIANENSFPTTNPDPSDDAGTVVSISDAGGLVVSASGTASGQTTEGTTVTITGFPSALQSSTLPAGQGLQVVSTSTLNTYTYHKVLGTDADIAQLNDDVNDFFARYRIGSTNPTTDLDAGDLFFNTSTGKMLVYDATVTAWEEVQAVGNYFINTLSSSSGTGGGSATFNGSAYRFTLSNPGSVAQQHIVSINGVIQKPNSGTSQPSEGFAIDNADIILAAAPATGSEFFIVTVGTSVNIGTPSNDTITNAMVKSDAAIAGTKISPDFGSQNVVTTGSVGIGTASPTTNLEINGGTNNNIVRIVSTDANANIEFADSTTTSGCQIGANGDNLKFGISGTEALRIDSSGRVAIGTTSATTDAQLTVADLNSPMLSFERTDAGLFDAAIGMDNSNDLSFFTGANSSTVAGLSERMRIDSSGKVGIGTTSPTADGLHIVNSTQPDLFMGTSTNAEGFKIVYADSSSVVGNVTSTPLRFVVGNSERARIDSSGRLLVGHSAAISTTALGAAQAQIVGTDNVSSQLSISRFSNDNDRARLTFIKSRSGTKGTNTILQSGDAIGRIEFMGADGSAANDYLIAAHIGVEIDGTPGADDMPGRLVFSTTADGASSPTERMRIDSSGTLKIGGTVDLGSQLLQVQGGSSSTADVVIANSVASTGQTATLTFGPANNVTGARIRCTAEEDFSTSANRTARLEFYTRKDGTLAERMRISSTGSMGVFASSADVFSSRSNVGASTSYSLFTGYHSGSSPLSGGTLSFNVTTNGNVTNTNNSYGAISDAKLKENIVDASSQWDDLKAIQVRNYNFIEGQTHTQIGVVAQEVETVSPGLVTESPDRDDDGNDLGTVTKSVNYSVLYMKAVKALQEAMTRIETLETQNADLAARITALEEGS